jgi:hypothetical protein
MWFTDKLQNILLPGGFIMNNFQTNGCVLLKGFIDPQGVQTISRYMEYSLKQQTFKLDDPTSKYARYADPLVETILYNSREELEEVTGLSLHPTYSYSRVYVKGDDLKPHVDRPSCEISVTVHIATQGAPWPIWMKTPGKEPVSFILEPGDAVAYKGCEVTHWREKAVDTEINAQIMLHYVDQNGPNAAFKWDERIGLGMPNFARSM